MPKIQEYGAPKLGYQAEGSTFVPSEVGEQSRQLRSFADSAETFANGMEKREAQEESSNLNASFSELAADVTVEIDDGTRDGTIDAQKYSQNVQQRIDKLSDGIRTRQGRVVFERNAARIKSQAFKGAARGQAAVAGARAQANLGTELASYSSALLSDPSEFKTNYSAFTASIDDQVATGALKAVDAEKLKREGGKDLAMAAGRGWAQLSPDLAEKKLKSGEFDGYIDGDKKFQLQRDIETQRSAHLTELQRQEALQKKTEKSARKAALAKNLDRINNGTMSAKEILALPGDEDGSKNRQLLEVVRKNAKDGGGVPDPAVISSVHERMLLPDGDPRKIVDESQIFDLVGKGLSTNDAKDAIGDLADTPDGKAMRSSQASALAVAKKTILQRGIMFYGSGVNSGASQQQLENWIKDTRNKRSEYLKAGKNVSDLYDSKNAAYVGSPEFLSKYQIQTNTPAYFNSQAQETLKNQPAFNTAPDDSVRKPGETIQQWKARQK